MRARIGAFAVAAVLTVGAGVAGAVQFGAPDDGAHPYVGLMVAQAEDGTPLWRCTGSLISANRFLTAGHCVGMEEPGGIGAPAHVEIWFDEHVVTAGNYTSVAAGGKGCANVAVTGYPCHGEVGGDPVAHPGWNGLLTVPNTHDIGMVELDQPVTGHGYGVLAGEGTLDGLATKRGLKNLTVELVGYGLQGVKPVLSQEKNRLKATGTIVSLGSAYTDGYNVRISSGPGKGNGPGGTCFGDSGGPVFYEGKIVAVNSFVLNLNCKGSGYGYRTDTPWSLEFVSSFAE
jgi:Trypsin